MITPPHPHPPKKKVYERCGGSTEQCQDRPEGNNPVGGRREAEPAGFLRSRTFGNQLRRLPGRGDSNTHQQRTGHLKSQMFCGILLFYGLKSYYSLKIEP